MRNTQVLESNMLETFAVGATLLPPLVLRSCNREEMAKGHADARIELSLPNESRGYRFVVEAKARSTPQAVEQAMMRARAAVMNDELPMVYVPYLSPEQLSELEKARVSGIDMCGNGIVVVPDRLWIVRSGSPNQYRDSRPLNNPFRGRSAMVARMLLKKPQWETLTKLNSAIESAGCDLSLPQTSKAVHALVEERLVVKDANGIRLNDPLRLSDKLGAAWSPPRFRGRQALRLKPDIDIALALSSGPKLKWAVTGESSVNRYATFAQGGPRRIAVSNMRLAMSLLQGEPESVPNFAKIELLETDEVGFFFDNLIDDEGVRWASPLQTWLELQAGDARQQDASKDLRRQILKEVNADNECR